MRNAVLFDLPTFPKGVIPLSLPTVAAHLRPFMNVRIIDLNFHPADRHRGLLETAGPIHLCGLKVSSQNLPFAIAFTRQVREVHPRAKVIWGGELPTLLPAEALKYADCVARGRFEPLARALAQDIEDGELRRIYESERPAYSGDAIPPAFDLIENPRDYMQFMGRPLESSLGCLQGCSFCLVHETQKKTEFRSDASLVADLGIGGREFINVVDYNIANDREHLLRLAKAIEGSSACGWMGEMCIESLDDDRVLAALRKSRCRMIYCGLESISSRALSSVAKSHNIVSDYGRIIRKAQSHGVQVACGAILGLEDTTEESLPRFRAFCEDVGIIYLKLTFLTFNPGAKVNGSMRGKGEYATESIHHYDGNRLTFLPRGVSAGVVFEGARRLIDGFYSLSSAWTRSRHLAGKPRERAEFMLFSHCYGHAYRQWLEFDVLQEGGGRFEEMLTRPVRKSGGFLAAERALCAIRRTAFAVALLLSLMPSSALGRDDDPRRTREVMRCASCHAKEYEDWRQGPHANSRAQLVEFTRVLLDPSSRNMSERRRMSKLQHIVKGEYAGCFSCHAPIENIYEGSIPADWDGAAPIKFKPLSAATVDHIPGHGVDCIACHVRGDRVVTRADYKPAKGFVPPKGFCNPLPSKTFSHMNNCMSCHEAAMSKEYVGKYDENLASPRFPYVSCNSCHMKPGTHFYKWASGERERGYVLNGYLGKIATEVQASDGAKRLTFRWSTDFCPHPLAFLLYTFVIEVLGKDKTPVFSTSVGFITYGPASEGGKHRRKPKDEKPDPERTAAAQEALRRWLRFVAEAQGRKPDADAKTLGRLMSLVEGPEVSQEETEKESERYLRKTIGEIVRFDTMSSYARTYRLPADAPSSGTVRVTVYRRKNILGWPYADVKLLEREEPYQL